MNKNITNMNPSLRITCLVLLLAGLFLLPLRAEAADAYVYFKGKTTPIFVANFTISYVNDQRPSKQIIAALPQELKYISYGLEQVREVEFLKQVGAERSGASFLLKLQLIRKGSTRRVVLMPITEFNGVYLGAPWVFPMDANRGYEENAEKLKGIRFVDRRK